MLKKQDELITHSKDNYLIFFYFHRLLEIVKSCNSSDLSEISKLCCGDNKDCTGNFSKEEAAALSIEREKIIDTLVKYNLISWKNNKVLLTDEGSDFFHEFTFEYNK